MSHFVSWCLNVSYAIALVAFSPLLLWAMFCHGKYREGFREKFLGQVPRRSGEAPCLWLHAVSVGEVNLLAPMIAHFRRRHADWEIVVSTTTKTGFELARAKYADLKVFFCPLDFSWAVHNALARIRPTMLALAELELWPNLIRLAKVRGAKVAIINGRLSDHSFRGYRRTGPLIRLVLRQIDIIAAQDNESARRFQCLGARPAIVHVTGSLKFDGAETQRSNPKTMRLRQLANIRPSDVIFLAGSTQDPEEEMAVNVFRHLAKEFPQLRLILVPRHSQRFREVAELLDRCEQDWMRRSTLANIPCALGDARARILLVDTIGELGAWWGAADIALVGGSFGRRGGQNMIEPAAYGAAVSFGPNTRNFREIVAALLRTDAAVVVKNPAQLEAFVRRCLNDPWYARELGQRAQTLVRSQLGATERTVTLLTGLFDKRPPTSSVQAA